jgi:aspartate/methionine/tyrosine aminotransferase
MVTPEFICRAADEAARAGHTFYTHTAGSPELRGAIATKIHELHGVRYRPSEIMATVGGTMAIYTAIRASVGAGDNAVVITPAYAIYVNALIMAGAEARQVPLAHAGTRLALDLDRVSAAIDAKTRMLIVNSPSNPTGWMMSDSEQRALAALAAKHDLIVLADEVYERLTFDRDIAPSMARVIDDKNRLIVINSFSKTYNMTGWRLGWAQSSETIIRTMFKAAEFITSNPTAMVQQAGIVALRDGEPFVGEQRMHLAQRRAQVVASLGRLPGVSLATIQGAFYAFFKVDAAKDSAAFSLALLQDTGLALAPGSCFGAGGEGWVRLCFASSETTMTDALQRLTGFIEQAP